MSRSRRGFVSLVAAAALACSGGGGSNPPPTPTLTVDPTEWSVTAGGAPKQFTATLTGSSDPVVWSIETVGAATEVGTLSSTGLYTPPPSLAVGRDVVLRATAAALVARATVHVGAAVDGVTITVTPAIASVVAGSAGTVAIHAATNYVGTVTWKLVPDLGVLDTTSGPDVTYTAPSGLVTATTDVAVTATAGVVADAATITVHPTVLQVTGPASVHAGGAPVAFVVQTDVGSNTVAWSVSPSSAGTISGTGSTATFTPAALVAADTPFQVVATVGEATGSASAVLQPATLGPATVAGTVVDETGHAYPGATVVIGGQSATSGADGSFSIANVTAPYDLTLIAELRSYIILLRGVSDVTPSLTVYRQNPGSYRWATVSGTVTDGAGQPVAARVFQSGSTFASSDATTGAYSMGASWLGDTTATLNYRALIRAPLDATGPTAYDYGVRAVPVTHTGTVTGQDLVVARLPSGHVTGTATSLPEASAPMFSIVARFDDDVTSTFWSRSVANLGAYDVVVPVVPDGSIRLQYAWDAANGGRATTSARVVPGQAGVQLAIPAIPVHSRPPDYAVGVRYTTPLVWTTAETGGVDSVTIYCGSRAYAILGGGRSVTIPDLTAYGVNLTPDVTTCSWSPGWDSGSVDDAVQGPAYGRTQALLRSSYANYRNLTF